MAQTPPKFNILWTQRTLEKLKREKGEQAILRDLWCLRLRRHKMLHGLFPYFTNFLHQCRSPLFRYSSKDANILDQRAQTLALFP